MSMFRRIRSSRRAASKVRTPARRMAPAVGMCALMAAAAIVPSMPARAQTTGVSFYALTDDNRLDFYSFKLRARKTKSRGLSVDRSRRITGLALGESLVGIDFRPANNVLYGLSTTNRLYTIDLTSAVATPVSTLSVPLSGTDFGFDFNPVPDRLRVVSDADQNLRINVDSGMVTNDTKLAFATTSPNTGVNPTVSALGYTNSFAGATATALYGIDTGLNALVLQNPPNAGTLNTVGPLGFDISEIAGFDISASNALAFASLVPVNSARSNLYSIDLTTGLASFLGRFASRSLVRDIALAPGQ